MEPERAQRIRDGLDRAAGAFWIAVGISWAIVLVALVLIGLVASVAWAAEKV